MRKLFRIIKILLLCLIVVFICIQLKRPARTNPVVDQTQTIEAHTKMTPQMAAILEHSCRDCHTNTTEWPWYSNVAPVSWFVTDHVNEGRKNMNMSEWGKMDRDRQSKKLRQMCDLAEDGVMPLSSYTPLHPGSALTEENKKILCDWTASERERIAAESN